MEIPDTWAALLLGAANDAMLFHDNLLQSETIRDKTDIEDHLLQLSILLEYMKDDYRQRLEPQGSLPLARFLPLQPEASNVVQIRTGWP
jgi:hypothetical protein